MVSWFVNFGTPLGWGDSLRDNVMGFDTWS